MSGITPTKGALTPLDRPHSYVGRNLSRAGAKRAVAGKGRYTDDFSLPHTVHAAFFRSPFAHARIRSIDTATTGQPVGSGTTNDHIGNTDFVGSDNDVIVRAAVQNQVRDQGGVDTTRIDLVVAADSVETKM